ncbi:putative teichuronic acid biosynthesis glycosyltransferase TuaG [Novipirellula galeiformis]|uniref:Putative teichuronic acid biosynthesis glycosyltransferase TuaG n=1 Tax=Novipirellula galeiformis TaxID=2528004 RepID=A0A5C6C0E0_9BACT|nr:glycosyltransferase family 2 protein [Novipirellula galeiformis]TWU17111.1 putative teichuronic acid biosynthesis glycosyltransferase TuaG [Novipirellula galeiformis]
MTMQKPTAPKISIVTPSYNQGAFLEETICSVLDQQYASLEYIVIDGGSTDQSVEIIKRYEKYLKYWVSEPDSGQTQAINKGFQHASGDVYAYLNSDDQYRQGALQLVAEDYLAASDRRRFWKAYVVEMFNSEGLVDTVYPNPDCELATWLSTSFGLLQPGVFWTRAMYEEAGGFDESLHYVFDRDFFMRLLRAGYRYTISRDFVAARYRIHEHAKTQRDNTEYRQEYDDCDRAFIESYAIGERKSLNDQIRKCKALGALADSDRTGIGRRARLENLFRAILSHPPVIGSRQFWRIVRYLPYPEHQAYSEHQA